MRTILELSNLKGRRALVLGGAGHIGRAAGEALAELGARVAVMDLDAKACAEAAKGIAADAVAVPCDLSDEPATRRAVAAAVNALGGLDILIHSAAFVGTTAFPGWAVPFEKQTVEAWDAALRINLTSAFVAVQAATKALAASGHGSVVLISSIHGVTAPDPRIYEGTSMGSPAGYGASKGGLLQLTRYLSAALAPKVRVNALSPGGVKRGQPEVFVKRYEDRTPLGRMATEEDMKGAVAFLASDLSAYVTGQNLVVDGGWTAW